MTSQDRPHPGLPPRAGEGATRSTSLRSGQDESASGDVAIRARGLTRRFGNVVAVAVSGFLMGGASISLNYFIPIADALKFLAIELGEPRVA